MERSALMRRESRGLHYLEDLPGASDDFQHDTVIPGLKGEDNTND